MDIKVGLSIYNKPWLIEPNAGLQLLDFWEKVKEGKATWNYRRAKSYADDDDSEPAPSSSEVFNKFFAKEGIVRCPEHEYEMREFKGFDGAKVVLIPVEGALMKHNFCGWFGTAMLAEMTRLAGRTKSVETIIHLHDSPGGAVDGTEDFSEAIRTSPKNTVAYTNGYCCSADYWLASGSDRIIVGNETDIIGSIGTMIAWYNADKYYEEMGIVLREFYATKSVDKNRAFNEADHKGDGKLLVQEMLNPLNNIFLKNVQQNRSGKLNLEKEDVLTGKVYTGVKAIEVGLADERGNFEFVLNEAMNMAPKNKSTVKQKTTTMSGKIIAFSAVMAAAKAEQFEVVEGGFLLTEEQLNNVNAVLEANETTAQATAKALKEANTALEAKGAASADLKASNERIAQLEADLKTAYDKVASLEAAAEDKSKFFSTTGRKNDPAPAHEEDSQALVDSLEHNQRADRLTGMFSGTAETK